MMSRKYLRGLDVSESHLPGVFAIPHARAADSWRLVCSYADGKRYKERLFADMRATHDLIHSYRLERGMSRASAAVHTRQLTDIQSKGTWEWHHVVEGQHFADVDFNGQLPVLYESDLPCVLIAKEEHTAYNRLLHTSETDELFRDAGLPAKLREGSAATAMAARNRQNHPKLRRRVEELRQLYRNAYAGDRVLTSIADNVFNEALTNLR